MISRRRRSSRLPLAIVVTVLGAAALAACGGDPSAAPTEGSSEASIEIPFGDGNAERGERLAASNGCQACHQVDEDRVGPRWGGLAGSMVTLDDGTTVLADREYLALAITDPAAQKVDGYQIAMPRNRLTAGEVADIVAYLESLGTSTP